MQAAVTEKSRKGLRKGLYLIPSAFTAANAALGFLSVIYSLRGFQANFVDSGLAAVYFDYAAKAIGLAILCDILDGRVARMTKTTTEIGVQLDSLADVLTFGIAPTILLYSWAIGVSFSEGSQFYNLGLFVLFMYLICGTFRLARFNIQATRPRVLMEGAVKTDKKNFVGLPIPPAAGLIAAIVHYSPLPLSSYPQAHTYSLLIMILVAILGILMVSTLRYSSLKTVGTGKNSLYLILVVAGIGMLIWLYSRYVLLGLSVIYVSHGLIWYLGNVLFSRRANESAIVSVIEVTEKSIQK
ncbi:MAG: phosphatidylcholine/phosphatidylserine synthase [Pyrinomonadaceae bacterium]|nr:phosphatidylcholine/phosphatidylserine synthase [Pyrinomonadaceae bacterium]MCX7639001.1 phosphatidylcholine/phosphatidylserine synthase [Pyrinomonadaceae bacterium]MDW8303779.1 phosphatidylcholine/phosphatidylserine synthase [Acidobacteriota bacterium]